MKSKLLACLAVVLFPIFICSCAADEAQWPGYSGTSEGYEYYYSEGRDRLWEEDILFMAENYLKEHPLLSNTNFFTMTLNNLEEAGGNYTYTYSNAHFNETLRAEFIGRINAIIPKISQLDDFGVRYEAAQAVALLADGHSGVNMDAGDMIPLLFECVGKESNVELCTVRAPKEYNHLLGSKLTSINGTPVKEIVENLTQYLGVENEYHAIHLMTNLYEINNFQLLTQKPALTAIGVVGQEDHAQFSFENENGIITEIMSFVPPHVYVDMELSEHDMVSSSSLRFGKDNNFWYTIVDAGDHPFLYARIRKMRPDTYDFNQFYNKIVSELRNAPVPLKLIMDFRDNGGGELQNGTTIRFAKAVNQCETGGVYILINGGCFSAAVATPYFFATTIEDAQLVGSPTGQFANSFGPIVGYCTPNFQMHFSISDTYYCHVPEEESDALYPDITVYQTWEDYQNNVDTVLQYVVELK